MTMIDQNVTALTALGADYEIVTKTVRGQPMRVYKRSPKNIAIVIHQARAFGAAECIVYKDQRLTYNDFFDRADRLSGWLQKEAGIKPGQSVAICMKNNPEWMISFAAIANIGAVSVLVNSRGQGSVMQMAIEDTDSVFLIADNKRLHKLRDAGSELPALCPDCDGTLAGVTAFTDVMKHPAEFEKVKRQSEDPAAMFFTSGTTGRAKAAVMTHRNIITGVANTRLAINTMYLKMARQYGMEFEAFKAHIPQTVAMMVFPLFHVSGCTATFLATLKSGGKMVMMDRWSGEEAARLIDVEKVSSFGGVPTMHWDLVRAAKETSYDLSSIQAISCGGQALPLGLLHEIRETFPNVIIGAGYGMTETSGAVSQSTGEAFVARPEASGQKLTLVDVKVTDEDGNELPQGAIGEFWVRGPTVMKEYYKRPDANAKAFKDGWFRTGDIGKVDEDGYLTVVDRKTDMVISGGENIYCAEVEQVLGKHPAVRQVVTFGVPDDRLGERLVASFVVDGQVSASDLMAYAKENLAAYKVPTDITVQTSLFELNAMGKVEKHKVRETYKNKKAA